MDDKKLAETLRAAANVLDPKESVPEEPVTPTEPVEPQPPDQPPTEPTQPPDDKTIMPTDIPKGFKLIYLDDFNDSMELKSTWSIYGAGVSDTNNSDWKTTSGSGLWREGAIKIEKAPIGEGNCLSIKPYRRSDKKLITGAVTLKSPVTQMYGRYEWCASADKGGSFNVAELLWNDKESWPVGGEIDAREMVSADRQKFSSWIHWGGSTAGDDSNKTQRQVIIDQTKPVIFALEWLKDSISLEVNGKEVWKISGKLTKPGPMRFVLQGEAAPFNGMKDDGSNPVFRYHWVRIFGVI